MRDAVLKDKTALVTGASSGLGLDFARQLAERGCHLIVVARREEALARLKQELEGRHGVRVQSIPMDLATPDAPQRLYSQVQTAGLQVDVLINNAGLGLFGSFADIPWERERAMLELDMLTVVNLTKLFVPAMVSRKFGYVLNIASIGAFQPTPTYASYAAAKAFVLSYSAAVNCELQGTGVHCTVLCPGVTRTEFYEVSGQKLTAYQRLTIMGSAEAARIGLHAMLQGRSSVVAGWFNAFIALMMKLIPRRWAASLARWVMTT